jgi:hypothetical protein
MTRTTSWIALSCAALAASAASGAFVITAVPSATPAPVGRLAIDFYAQNDSGGVDGSSLLGTVINFTGSNGTKVFFATFDNGGGNFSVDPFNFGPGTSGTNVLDTGASNFRFENRLAGQHAYLNYPSSGGTTISADQANNGFGSFFVAYVGATFAAAVPTPTAPGARFARLVFNSTAPSAHLAIKLSGEIGPYFDYTYDLVNGVGFSPSSTATVNLSAPGGGAFGPVTATGMFDIQNVTIPAQIQDNITISGSGATRTFSGSGFTEADRGVYQLIFNDGGAGGVFSLTVVPEPISLGSITGLAIVASRRRDRAEL